jgi:NADPH:quinone reductase-like Zn-dependent oxidoreductase
VTATTSSQEKINWLLGLPNGATHAVNYKTEDFSAVIKQITDGKGADVIIDVVGQSHFNKNLDSLAVDGRMIILSLLSGEKNQVGIPCDAENHEYKEPWLILSILRPSSLSACTSKDRLFVLAVSSTRQNSSPGKPIL